MKGALLIGAVFAVLMFVSLLVGIVLTYRGLF